MWGVAYSCRFSWKGIEARAKRNLKKVVVKVNPPDSTRFVIGHVLQAF
jgi:hypothetical protein